MGNLITPRIGHNAIYDGVYIIVAGGVGNYKTKVCSFDDDKVSCTEQNPDLNFYAYTPELFLVPDNFCK